MRNFMKKKRRGFTMIEMLMVILLVAILAVVAIPQFIDFRTEAKNAATQSVLGAIRSGIMNQYTQSLLRCGASAGTWPTLAGLNANDNGTAGGGACVDAEIPSAAERQFIAQTTLPSNPWGTNATVRACVAAGCTRCNANGCDNATAGGDLGWCYNAATGDFWADSAANGLATTECNY
jgi:prepilin-type N-terminal cleavage/methylation domain-containing protein